MEAYERDRLLKEEEERKELEQTIGLMDFISDMKELANRGKDVHPGAKNRKDLQNVAKSLKMSVANAARKKSTSNDMNNIYEQDEYTSDYIDLLSKPRTLLYEGVVNKRELDGRLNLSFKSSFRYLFLLSDALLITYKKDIKSNHIRSLNDSFELNHVIWMKDMRLHDILPISTKNEREPTDTNAFELIVAKTRFRDQYSLQFSCDNARVKTEFLKEISYTLYAYHKSTPISQYLGWNHRLIVGTLHSSAYLGDLVSLKRIVKGLVNQSDVDAPDQLGMSALHWAVLNGHEACVRFIVEKGGDIDRIQGGMNTPFLLACCKGYDSICRMLLDRGADLYARNVRDCDAVIMAVVYGHASKGLPWVLQLLTSRGLDLNGTRDRTGATPLHLCAERNLARPVRMLVDSGADVNAKHEVNKLTPLQMACKHSHPDVETIRSFLDKGAYPNWRDSEGRTAWDIIIREQQKYMISCVKNSGADVFGGLNMDMFDGPDTSSSSSTGSERSKQILQSMMHNNNSNTPNSPMDGSASGFGSGSVPGSPGKSVGNMRNSFRNVVDAVGEVGDWAVEALPTLLEITKRGCRFDGNMKELDNLRPSFRNAILEARVLWENASIENVGVTKVLEFVQAREQAGETFLCDKEHWAKDDSSPHCLLCAGMTIGLYDYMTIGDRGIGGRSDAYCVHTIYIYIIKCIVEVDRNVNIYIYIIFVTIYV